MACYRPLTVFRPLEGGAVSFRELKNSRETKIKCGNCVGCRIERQEMWSIRCLAESKMHAENCFLTLTYDDDHLPLYGALVPRDLQLFVKRMRNECGKFRYFAVGEYGEKDKRPHYHMLVFGYNFPDRVRCNSVYSKRPVYRSDLLERVWKYGFSTIGDVTYASAKYVAGYVLKKVSYQGADHLYERLDYRTGEIQVVPREFARMSLKPGIGHSWLVKYWRDLYATGHDAFIVDGRKHKIPRYFDEQMDKLVPLLMDEVEYRRYLGAEKYSADNTADRLAVREQVKLASIAFEKGKKGESNAL